MLYRSGFPFPIRIFGCLQLLHRARLPVGCPAKVFRSQLNHNERSDAVSHRVVVEGIPNEPRLDMLIEDK